MAKYCNWVQEFPAYQSCFNMAEGSSGRCDEHPKEKPKRAGNLTTAQKDAIRQRDEGICAECGEPANEVDHIVELYHFDEDELWKANLASNLQLLCKIHHQEKTTKFRREELRTPVADIHDRSLSPRARKKRRMKAQGYGNR